jgi:hypothetical protein
MHIDPSWPRLASAILGLALAASLAGCSDDNDLGNLGSNLRVGVATVPITPCGQNPAWDGPITATGVWGEPYEDVNGNGRYDVGEPYEDDPRNDALDPQSKGKYDGIYMAGFGGDRVARGCHDDLWARAIVLDDGKTKISFTVIDVVGALKHGTYYGFARAEAMLDPALGLTHRIFASTHNHEGPDTLGLWGVDTVVDGKFPLYMTFVDRQVARAITEAAANLVPVGDVTAMHVSPAEDAELLGLQVRTGCRPPFIFDEDLRALAFRDSSGAVIATVINWATHPESLESENEMISSDFPGFLRDEVEKELGGTAVYFSGDLGAVEIVGDTCVGGAPPRNPDGSNELDSRDDLGFARTETIGRTVGGAVVRGLSTGESIRVASVDVRSAEYRVPASNQTFELGRMLGVLDLDPAVYDPSLCPGAQGLCGPAEQYAVTFLDRAGAPRIEIATVPGEVFPELFLGVATHRRTDCPAADTGRPPEPSIRDAMRSPYKLVIGLSPDEIGYIVPGYDFYPANIFDEASDPCVGQPYDPAFPRRRVPTHYHEVLSVGVEAASFVTCHAVELFGGESATADVAACQALP